MRIRKMVGAKEALLAFPDLILPEPTANRGRWGELFQKEQPLHLEIGMGRGKFLAGMAKIHPEVNFVGLEFREELVFKAAKRLGQPPGNLLLILGNGADLRELFAPGEVSRIYLNFSDPWPKERHGKRRLTSASFLDIYREILIPRGEIHLKTDNRDFFQYSMNSMADAGFFLKNINLDLHRNSCPDNILTEYEERFMNETPIYRCEAVAMGSRGEQPERRMDMYISTRGNYGEVSAAEAIKLGMVPGGGLFVPASIPVLTSSEIYAMAEMTYSEVAKKVMSLYLPDYPAEELDQIIRQSYGEGNFDSPQIAPLVHLNDNTYVLELWHGPTAAFKDMALQIMPRLLSAAREKVGGEKEILILVATSGDTGKAALEGFKNIPGIKIIVFYPHGGVSRVQELQMITTDGDNTWEVAVYGNFDDCQTAVKEIFADDEFAGLLREKGIELSSANSINWGRLLPQIVYYFWAYSRLLSEKGINPGEKINLVVPTGNFGNILAGYYAYRMGLPVHKFISASNENKVLADVIKSGVYDRRRDFVKTLSPSMDILISSNFERFLFEITGHDSDKISGWFQELAESGSFQLDDQTRERIQTVMEGGAASDMETKETIKKVFKEHGYLLDTHTAVGMRVYENYQTRTSDMTPAVIDATANPYKFNKGVLEALTGETKAGRDEFTLLEELHTLSGMPIHPGLQDLDKKPVHSRQAVEKDRLRSEILNILDLKGEGKA